MKSLGTYQESRDERGATMVEYAMLLLFVTLSVASLQLLGLETSRTFENVAMDIHSPSDSSDGDEHNRMSGQDFSSPPSTSDQNDNYHDGGQTELGGDGCGRDCFSYSTDGNTTNDGFLTGSGGLYP